MRSSFKKRQISVFSKILFIFIIVVFPLYFFSLQVNIWGQNEVRNELAYSAGSKISFYIDSLKKDFDSIIKLESALMNNEDLKKLNTASSVTDDFQSYKSMNAVRDKLRELKDINSYIAEATVYFPRLKKQISTLSISDMNVEQYKQIKALTNYKIFPFSTFEQNIYINITSDLYNSAVEKASESSYIISVKVSKSKLQKVLEQFAGTDESGAVLIGDYRGLSISDESGRTILSYLTDFLAGQDKKDENSGIETIKTPEGRYIISYEKSSFLHSTLLIYMPEERFLGSIIKYRSWLWIMSILTLILAGLFTFWTRSMIARPLDKLIGAFKKVEDGELNISVKYERNDEFGYLYKHFNQMLNRLGQLIEQVYEQKIRVQNAELKQLQYQINPHFLYNCIFIIYRMAKMNDAESIQKLSQHLGNYYQFVTRSAADEVPLEREANHARDYVEIQTIRFADRINIEFDDIPEDCRKLPVPRLILQPVIENAYNHGLHNKTSGGRLKISFSIENNIFNINVEDNGDELDDVNLDILSNALSSNDQKMESTGLINVHRRLQIKYGTKGGIFVSRSELGGLRVNMRIVLEEANNVQTADCR